MKSLIAVFLIFSLVGSSLAQDPGWPREKTNPGGTLIYYQPQLDEWKEFRRLEARMAVSIKAAGGQPTVGVIYLRARTDANLETRNVVISKLEITSTRFPSLDAGGAAAMDQLVRAFLPPSTIMNISLDRLLAELEETKQVSAPAAAVKNDPPKIFVNYGNAILLLVEGDPVLAPIEKTKLEFLVNTNWDVFFDKLASQYYLLNDKQWLAAASLEGPWTATSKLPNDMSKLPEQPNWENVKKAIPPPTSAGGTVPKVLYSSTPAEILTFKGQPKYAPIPNTQLVYATNTESDVFVHNGEKQYYYLVAGRWFRAKSLDGPWSYASADLPSDFALIPPNSERSRVLVSVPGTDEANDAVLMAQVPTTVIVDRAKAEAEVKVSYDGDPQFKPIESTDLSYASNTQDKIIKVGDLYYLCFQGVWFMSTSPEGPWKTADSVPKEIYTIPPSSPVYNVTYVTQTTTSTGETEASSTAGYLGMFIIGMAVGATVCYGSGYYYPPYYYYGPYPYPIYRPYPVTYGVGAYYNPHNGAYGYARGAYGPYGGVAGAAWQNTQASAATTSRQTESQPSTTQAGATSQQAARGTGSSTGRQAGAQPTSTQSGSVSQRQGQAAAGTGQSGQIQDLNREAQARERGTQRTQNYQRQSQSGGGRSGGTRQRGSNR